MEKIIENFRFILEMDAEINDLCYTVLMDTTQVLYKKLLDYYPGYRELVQQKYDLAETIFKNMEDGSKYNEIIADLETPTNFACLLYGLKVGTKMLNSI